MRFPMRKLEDAVTVNRCRNVPHVIPMDWIEEILIECPQCGECFAIQVETAAEGSVELIEDCAVCCRPAAVSITVREGEVTGVTVDVS